MMGCSRRVSAQLSTLPARFTCLSCVPISVLKSKIYSFMRIVPWPKKVNVAYPSADQTTTYVLGIEG